MSDELSAGLPVEIAPGVRRLVAPNPGVMTGPGTNTYLLGRTDVAVIDPGPAIPAHLDAIEAAASGNIHWVFVTHTHPDHSPAAKELAARTGATLLGRPPPDGQYQDRTFEPDRVLEDEELFVAPEFSVLAVHTPGHASNHLCYRHEELNWLFTGDHIMSGSTVVINPPDGNMGDYLRSLERLKGLGLEKLAPGHGEVIDEPLDVVDWLISHRLGREAKVANALAAHPGSTTSELVPFVYDDIDPGLFKLAERSLLAHLIKLEEEGSSRVDSEIWWPS